MQSNYLNPRTSVQWTAIMIKREYVWTTLSVVGIETRGGDQSLTVGEMSTITCSTSLDISDIVWIDDLDTIVASNSEGVQQLDLVFNPVNDSIHNRMYTCTITSVAVDQSTDENLVISKTITVHVRGK